MLSPEQKHRVLQEAARLLVDEIKETCQDGVESLYLIPVSIAAKMLGIDSRTVKTVLPIVSITPKNHGVRMSDLQDFLERRTIRPAKRRKGAA